MTRSTLFIALILAAPFSTAGDDTVEAAIGGAIGGGVGAAIGQEVGGREGAIIGGAIGGAAGAAVATDDRDSKEAKVPVVVRPVVVPSSHPGRHCPPGQAKKGRC